MKAKPTQRGCFITVEQRHIDAGKLKNEHRCPVALAAKDAGLTDVRVTRDRLHSDGRHHKLPAKAQRFVGKFDAGKPVSPTTFRLVAL